ncbi:hypothetical protein BC835DRAFT_347453 [Cytidiella melzeri]|nr:hypothetical protein BC835DRAFT_347453 [Cytidiella melzeri]
MDLIATSAVISALRRAGAAASSQPTITDAGFDMIVTHNGAQTTATICRTEAGRLNQCTTAGKLSVWSAFSAKSRLVRAIGTQIEVVVVVVVACDEPAMSVRDGSRTYSRALCLATGMWSSMRSDSYVS